MRQQDSYSPRLALEKSDAPLSSPKAMATFGGVFLLAAIALPMSACHNPFKGPSDEAFDAMGKAFEQNGSLGRCVVSEPKEAWRIIVPYGEETFPVLKLVFPNNVRLKVDGRGCMTQAELDKLEARLEDLKRYFSHCREGACAIISPQSLENDK